eukprot:jgi/Antlo1/81/1360
MVFNFMTQSEAAEQDRRLFELGLDVRMLIEVAGYSAFEVLAEILAETDVRTVAVLVGPGNNGGDGLVIARYLRYAEYDVTVVCVRTKYADLVDICRRVGVHVTESADVGAFDVVVDALFGFSFRRPLREPYDALVRSLEDARRVISIDVPSGYDVDSAENCGFRPEAVICYTAPKVCCKGLSFYVTRSFVPSVPGFPQNYACFRHAHDANQLAGAKTFQKRHRADMDERPKTIFLFDVDGTLTRSRQKIEPKMKETLQRLKKVVYTAFVGGSDLQKQEEQIGDDCLDLFDFGFPENGVSFYRGRELVSQESIIEFMGEELHRELVEFTMRYIADLDIPVKRGTFLELRRSMINISPIGRNCSQDERMMFFSLDKERGIRKEMVRELERRFGERGMHFCIGGQISIDCFPKGWDKTYCLRHLRDFNTIVFFGDKTEKGGNDYEIFTDERTVSVSVSCPEDTIQKIDEMLKKVVEK